MRDDRFLRALGDIDDSYVDGALEDVKSAPARPIKRIVILAACVAVVAATFAVMIPAMMKGKNNVPDDVKGTVVASVPDETEPKETEPKETIPYIDSMRIEWPDRSLDEIVGEADLIVRAKNMGFEPSYYDGGVLYTDFLFEVVESYKGDRAVGDDVAVKCNGGFIGDLKTSIPGETPIKEGQEYILILSHEPYTNGKSTGNDRYVYYPPRGILTDDGTGVFTAQDPAVSYTATEFRAEIERNLD